MGSGGDQVGEPVGGGRALVDDLAVGQHPHLAEGEELLEQVVGVGSALERVADLACSLLEGRA